MVSRRTFVLGGLSAVLLAGAGTFAAVEEGELPGRIRLAELAGHCDADARPAPGPVGIVKTGSFSSSARKCTVGWALALPPVAGAELPVCVVLHGHGGDHTTAFADLELDRFLAAAVGAGTPPFALASVDGGNAYWHPRKSGENPLAMITDEFLPVLAKLGVRTDRIATMGWSMGGYGALLLARESHRGNLKTTSVAAAAAGSPALFGSFRSSASGSFDDPDDFAKYGTLAAQPDVGTTPVYAACGSDDAFTQETKRYRRNVSPTPSGAISRGCHTEGYWRSIAAAQLAFVGTHLA